MNHYSVIAFSGFSDGGASWGVFDVVTFVIILLAFAPIGALLAGGWWTMGGLIWISVDCLIVWRLWSSVTLWGQKHTWHIWLTWAIASALGLLAYLGMNVIVALAVNNLR